MASKRKSTTPCMVRASETAEQEVPKDCNTGDTVSTTEQDSRDSLTASDENCENDCEVIEGKSSPANPTKKTLGGYECKYCPYSTQNLNEFTEHIDIQHPNVILNPLYICAECNFTTKKYDCLSEHNINLHPGVSNFKLKLIKLNNQTVLEQSIEVTNNSVAEENSECEVVPERAGSMDKIPTVITAGKPKTEAKKISIENHLDGIHHFVTETTEAIPCVNGAELLQDIMTHVMPSVQLPPNINLVPKIPVPLNSTKYNSALDTNTTMINSFNKFPYPTQAELSWLTAASKHPEEQIRIWFATQRLKHGISWSPEEVEEARKKMFNGTIQAAPQTITVLPAQVTTAKITQPLIQATVPCQILSQTGLVLTQVSSGSTISPVTVAVASSQGQKRSLQKPLATPEVKRPHILPAEVLPKQSTPSPHSSTAAVSTATLPMTPSSNERKKTKEQIAVLKASFVVSQFPDNAEVYKLMQITGLSRADIKKWFSDYRYRTQKGIVHISSESIAKRGRTLKTYPDVPSQKFKGKSAERLRILEESFRKSPFPTQSELERLRTEVMMSKREIESWFSGQRGKDNTGQVVLDSVAVSVTNKDQGISNGSVSQTAPLNVSQATSSPRCSTTHSSSSQEQDHFLKKMFARSQWPSPQEYDALAAQTGLTKTEIVRWFKENRNALKNGSLKWLDQYREQYGLDECNNTTEAGPSETLKDNNEALQEPTKESQKLTKSMQNTGESECEGQDSQGNNEDQNTGPESWVEPMTIGGEEDDDEDDEDEASDCVESWAQTVPESKSDCTSESLSADNSHT